MKQNSRSVVQFVQCAGLRISVSQPFFHPKKKFIWAGIGAVGDIRSIAVVDILAGEDIADYQSVDGLDIRAVGGKRLVVDNQAQHLVVGTLGHPRKLVVGGNLQVDPHIAVPDPTGEPEEADSNFLEPHKTDKEQYFH